MSLDLEAEFGLYMTLESIEVRERTLSSLRSSNGYEDMKGGGKLGKHDYIILTVIDRNHGRFSFVAEKISKLTLCAGRPSYINMVPLDQYSAAASAARSRYFRELGNQTVSTEGLNKILTTTGHHYSVFSDNCWSYATRTVEAMLDLCLRDSQRRRDSFATGGCVEALWHLQKVKRPLPRDILRLFYKPFSRKNPDTLRKIGNWVESSSH